MPEIIIVAGPNGAGKTSFAKQFFARSDPQLEYVNADEIARKLPESVSPQMRRDIEAARLMLKRMEELAFAGKDFVIETTLSALIYVEKVRSWQKQGYRVVLIFLRLPSADHAIERVRRRVAAGGHNIPEATIRRRFSQGLEYLEMYYKRVVDEWYIWDSLEGDFELTEAWDDR